MSIKTLNWAGQECEVLDETSSAYQLRFSNATEQCTLWLDKGANLHWASVLAESGANPSHASLAEEVARLMEKCRLIKQIAIDQLIGLANAPCTSEYCYGGTCHRCASSRRAKAILGILDGNLQASEEVGVPRG